MCGENFKMANFMYGYIFDVLGGVQYGKFIFFQNFVFFAGWNLNLKNRFIVICQN